MSSSAGMSALIVDPLEDPVPAPVDSEVEA